MTKWSGPCYIDRALLETPAQGTEVMINCWWWEKDGQILDYHMNGLYYAQANQSKDVIDHMIATGVKLYLGHTPVLIPVAYHRRKR